MKKRIALAALVVVALGALAVAPMMFGGPMGRRFSGHAFGHGRGHDFAEGFMLGRLSHVKDELDLSDTQIDQIKAIVQDLREQNAPYRESVRGGIHDIVKTLVANPNDLAGAQAKIDAQANAEKALKTNVLNATSKALNVLTPEQRTKLATIIDKHATRMQERFEQ
ncbi:MAG: Spy/CpxP family protein refolding chaperone [Thermoanaerobaculia bacterium]